MFKSDSLLAPQKDKVLLHIWVIGPTAALGHRPVDVLARVFDVACFAMHAILRVDLELLLTPLGLNHFIYACRAIALRGLSPEGQVLGNWD